MTFLVVDDVDHKSLYFSYSFPTFTLFPSKSRDNFLFHPSQITPNNVHPVILFITAKTASLHILCIAAR